MVIRGYMARYSLRKSVAYPKNQTSQILMTTDQCSESITLHSRHHLKPLQSNENIGSKTIHMNGYDYPMNMLKISDILYNQRGSLHF